MLVPHRLDFNFTVVRDPLARMFSEYRFQAGISFMSRLGFSTWLRVMIQTARRERRIYANHIRPQVDLILDGAEVFRLEDGFDPMIARLDEVLGGADPSATIQHINKRERRPIPVYRQDIALIRHFYSEDYARLGYPPPDLVALPTDPFAILRGVFARLIAPAIVMLQRYRWIHPPHKRWRGLPIPRAVTAVAGPGSDIAEKPKLAPRGA